MVHYIDAKNNAFMGWLEMGKVLYTLMLGKKKNVELVVTCIQKYKT